MKLFDQLTDMIDKGKLKPLCAEHHIQSWIDEFFQNQTDLDFLIEELVDFGYLEAAE